MIRDAVKGGVDANAAILGLRALSRYYGGQMIYIPIKIENSQAAEDMRGIFADVLGDADADKLLEIITRLYGASQWYIPVEVRAFRKQIRQEIFFRYDGKAETMRDLCREYKMSFTQIYRLWHEYQANVAQREFLF